MREEVLFRARPAMFRNHPFAFVGYGIAALIGGSLTVVQETRVAGLVVGGLFSLLLLRWWMRCLGTSLMVTGDRTVLRKGLLSRHINEVEHRHVRNVQISQTLAQRLLGVGSIGISCAGQSGVEIGVSGIANPDRVKQIINDHRERA